MFFLSLFSASSNSCGVDVCVSNRCRITAPSTVNLFEFLDLAFREELCVARHRFSYSYENCNQAEKMVAGEWMDELCGGVGERDGERERTSTLNYLFEFRS